MLDRSDLPGYRTIRLSRISDPSSTEDSSLNRQLSRTDEEYQKLEAEYDAEIVEVYRLRESASTMDRESLNEIIEMAKNDQFDILMLTSIDRLTRAHILDTTAFLNVLRNNEKIIYTSRDGYFDWDDHDDTRRLVTKVNNAREWRNALHDTSIESNREILDKGHWPYGPIGYGLVDKEEGGIALKPSHRWIPETAFQFYVQHGDIDIVWDKIADRTGERDIDPPSKAQLERMLENELYTGELIEKKSEEFVRTKEDLAVVDKDVFDKVQDMLSASTNDDNIDFGPHDFPPFVYDLISRLGQEYIVDNISAIRWCCPKCGSTELNISDTTIETWGISIPKISCKESGCGYRGKAIRLIDLQNIDSTLPFVCPECQRTGDFAHEPISVDEIDDELYRYTCNYCGEYMIKNKHPNLYNRALNESNAVNLRENTSDGTAEKRRTGDNEGGNEEKGDKERTEISKSEVFDALESWLRENGPRSENVQQVMLHAAKILNEEDSLRAKELRDRLSTSHTDEYSTPKSMWYSTVARYHSRIPGFRRISEGSYSFDADAIRGFLNKGIGDGE